MRKQMKIKRRSCGLCHPNKKGWANRWPARQAQAIHEFDIERRALLAGAWAENAQAEPVRFWIFP